MESSGILLDAARAWGQGPCPDDLPGTGIQPHSRRSGEIPLQSRRDRKNLPTRCQGPGPMPQAKRAASKMRPIAASETGLESNFLQEYLSLTRLIKDDSLCIIRSF